jgi:hypothetical protein
MRYLRYLALLSIFLLPATISHAAQVSIGVGIGVPAAPVPVYAAPPACAYGYYPYAPYACAPYGYYGPQWFTSGVFIGAGPWFHPYRGFYAYHPGYAYGRPAYYGRPGFYDYGRPVYGRPAVPYRRNGFHGEEHFHGGRR